ncbi:MAG: hypothetical protein IKM04_08190 [Clostridia bacterium]|nr:hypothetical protein [Clostridia bacterium]
MPENRSICGRDREQFCIHTRKVYDACRSKDCLEDIRVYLTCEGQAVLNNAINVKPKSASILWTYVDVEPVPFNDGFYTVDAKFFYRIEADAFCGMTRPVEIEGLATFDKRAILYGSEGSAKIFSSRLTVGDNDKQLPARTNLPTATVEVVDPVLLGVKVAEACDRFCGSDSCSCRSVSELPECICGCFRDRISQGDGERRLYATLGQFSIIRLERDTQITVPAYEYCVPEKECGHSESDACDMFARFSFPVNEFFPPDKRGDNCGCK